ncbi:MAG TPA: thiolase family protein [Candidatus Deferrimicrobiaceae bacterium]|jgi:acetyl-CoA acetyltransferase|nr:thiolase family protein [Candidatus Deferrimicrobiaceae bacterium]
MRDVCIVGMAETAVGRLEGSTSIGLQAEASRLALADAGLPSAAVDAVYNLDPYTQAMSMFAQSLLEYMGLTPTLAATIDAGGTVTPMTMILNAIAAIGQGYAEVALCTFGENALTGRPKGVHGLPQGPSLGQEEFEEPFGCIGMVIPYALAARRHMHHYGTTKEQLGAVAVSARGHAALNPRAQMRKPLTMADYLAARPIADPFGLLDCSVMSDGAGAVVLTTVERARDLATTPVRVLGFGGKATHKNVNQMPDLGALGLRPAGEMALGRAGIGIGDADFCCIHDAFTISTILGVEALGLCADGEGGAYAAAGRLDLGGPCPVNPHGGLLSHAHIGGMNHLCEAVRQLRHEAEPARQVPDARVGVVSGNGGVFSLCGVMVLARGL